MSILPNVLTRKLLELFFLITLPVYGILTDDNSAIVAGAVVGALCGVLLLHVLAGFLVLCYHKRKEVHAYKQHTWN